MNYEYEDYRKKPEPPSWTEWQVPKALGWDYIFKVFLAILVRLYRININTEIGYKI